MHHSINLPKPEQQNPNVSTHPNQPQTMEYLKHQSRPNPNYQIHNPTWNPISMTVNLLPNTNTTQNLPKQNPHKYSNKQVR